ATALQRRPPSVVRPIVLPILLNRKSVLIKLKSAINPKPAAYNALGRRLLVRSRGAAITAVRMTTRTTHAGGEERSLEKVRNDIAPRARRGTPTGPVDHPRIEAAVREILL